MIPFAPDEELEDVPEFKNLWEHVTMRLLDEHGARRKGMEWRHEKWAKERGRYGSRGQERTAGISDRDGDVEDGDVDDSFAGEDGSSSWLDGVSHEKKTNELPDLDEELQRTRVRTMKRTILRGALAELPYVTPEDDTAGSTTTKTTQYPATEKDRPSRIPLRIGNVSNIATASGGDEMADQLGKLSMTADQTEHDDASPTTKTETLSSARIRDLILLVSTYLDVHFNPSLGRALPIEQEELLAEDLGMFKSNISIVAGALSSQLVTLEKSLCKLSNIALHGTGDDASAITTPPYSSLLTNLQQQSLHLHNLHTKTLPFSLTTLHSTLHTLLILQRQLLHLQLQHLETSHHGVLSRYYTSKLVFLKTVAQTMALKSQVVVLEARQELELSPEAEKRKAIMREQLETTERGEEGLDERIKILEGAVREYETLDAGGRKGEGGDILRKLGQRYGEIEVEMEKVRIDIEMLERKTKG